MTFGRLLGGAGGRGEACLSLQILQNGEKIHSRPAPPAGERRILRLRPCRRPLWQSQALWLLAWRLGNILIGSLACWVSLSVFCFASTVCWSVCWLAGSWMLDSWHFCNQFSGLWCPWVSFRMLGASTLASWGTLRRSRDDPGTILGHWRAQGRTL